MIFTAIIINTITTTLLLLLSLFVCFLLSLFLFLSFFVQKMIGGNGIYCSALAKAVCERLVVFFLFCCGISSCQCCCVVLDIAMPIRSISPRSVILLMSSSPAERKWV